MWYIVVAVVVLLVILVVVAAFFVGFAVAAKKEPIEDAEEKGPMPKRHGGFGQAVHGGKS